MSNPGKPAWPAPGAFPFLSFPLPGMTPPATAPSPPSGLASGMDMLKNFWGALPGSSQVPGFLVPTVDLDELDKRLADLRAAESWVEVNLNMLRATIQGLEVQRHTIAALKSLSSVSDAAGSAPFASPFASPFPPPASAKSTAAPAAAQPPAEAGGAVDAVDAVDATAANPGLAAGQWLGFLQDQFAKVAQAALAPGKPAAAPAAATASTPARKRVARKPAPARKRTAPRG